MPNYRPYRHWDSNMASAFSNALGNERSNIYIANQFRGDMDPILLMIEHVCLFAIGLLAGNFTHMVYKSSMGIGMDVYSYWGGAILLNMVMAALFSRFMLGIMLITQARKTYAVTAEMRDALFVRTQHLYTTKVVLNGLMWFGACVVGGAFNIWIAVGLVFIWPAFGDLMGQRGYLRYFLRVM